MKDRFTPGYEATLRGMINPKFVDQRGTESYERATLLAVIDGLRDDILAEQNRLDSQLKNNSDLLQQLAASAAEIAHWKANHNNVVAKLRLFTQREDLPVDRLPAYQRVLAMESEIAALRKDAERYRWLREQPYFAVPPNKTFDEEIDAAIARQGEKR